MNTTPKKSFFSAIVFSVINIGVPHEFDFFPVVVVEKVESSSHSPIQVEVLAPRTNLLSNIINFAPKKSFSSAIVFSILDIVIPGDFNFFEAMLEVGY